MSKVATSIVEKEPYRRRLRLQDCFLGMVECFLCFGKSISCDIHFIWLIMSCIFRVLQGKYQLSPITVRFIISLFSQDCCECFADIICTLSLLCVCCQLTYTASRLPLRDVLLNSVVSRTLSGRQRCILVWITMNV